MSTETTDPTDPAIEFAIERVTRYLHHTAGESGLIHSSGGYPLYHVDIADIRDALAAARVSLTQAQAADECGVTQTIFAGRDDDVPGNCLQAAIATYFDKPLDLIPHFVVFPNFEEALRMWLRQFSVGDLELERVSVQTIPDERCLLVGKSPRGVSHVVVAENGAVTWDPHPSREGLSSILEAWFFRETGRAASLLAQPATMHVCDSPLLCTHGLAQPEPAEEGNR